MLKKILQKLLRRPVSIIADKFSSRPDKKLVHSSLSDLYEKIMKEPGKKGPVLSFDNKDRFIILSDLHKGGKDDSDIFAFSENNYLAALDHYDIENFTLIILGDSEELWANTLETVREHNQLSFEKEKVFLNKNKFVKIFGNHDLLWDNDPLAGFYLESIYGQKVKIYEGAVLEIKIREKSLTLFLTHGHQGDLQSDGNWFSKWFVANLWAPLQMFLELNINTPSVNDHLKTLHNAFMYDWIVTRKDMLLITGHTHQPVFESLTQLERLYRELSNTDAEDKKRIDDLKSQIAKRIHKGDTSPDFTAYQPTYFNSGCGCFNDGDVTGIEVADGCIRLVKWEYTSGKPQRIVLQSSALSKYV